MSKKKLILRILITVSAVFLVIELVGYYLAMHQSSKGKPETTVDKGENLSKLRLKNISLRRRIKNLTPKGVYIVVDSARNVLYLKKGTEVVHQAVISCGSGSILEEPGGKRKWVFDTPRGEFYVKSRIEDPDWIRPDWAFIEEGKEIPRKSSDRVEPGVLGDYALGFGNGYFIHGTLYSRLLGRSVTHGCIRVGDDDLKLLFKVTSIGTKIFIY